MGRDRGSKCGILPTDPVLCSWCHLQFLSTIASNLMMKLECIGKSQESDKRKFFFTIHTLVSALGLKYYGG